MSLKAANSNPRKSFSVIPDELRTYFESRWEEIFPNNQIIEELTQEKTTDASFQSADSICFKDEKRDGSALVNMLRSFNRQLKQNPQAFIKRQVTAPNIEDVLRSLNDDIDPELMKVMNQPNTKAALDLPTKSSQLGPKSPRGSFMKENSKLNDSFASQNRDPPRGASTTQNKNSNLNRSFHKAEASPALSTRSNAREEIDKQKVKLEEEKSKRAATISNLQSEFDNFFKQQEARRQKLKELETVKSKMDDNPPPYQDKDPQESAISIEQVSFNETIQEPKDREASFTNELKQKLPIMKTDSNKEVDSLANGIGQSSGLIQLRIPALHGSKGEVSRTNLATLVQDPQKAAPQASPAQPQSIKDLKPDVSETSLHVKSSLSTSQAPLKDKTLTPSAPVQPNPSTNSGNSKQASSAKPPLEIKTPIPQVSITKPSQATLEEIPPPPADAGHGIPLIAPVQHIHAMPPPQTVFPLVIPSPAPPAASKVPIAQVEPKPIQNSQQQPAQEGPPQQQTNQEKHSSLQQLPAAKAAGVSMSEVPSVSKPSRQTQVTEPKPQIAVQVQTVLQTETSKAKEVEAPGIRKISNHELAKQISRSNKSAAGSRTTANTTVGVKNTPMLAPTPDLRVESKSMAATQPQQIAVRVSKKELGVMNQQFPKHVAQQTMQLPGEPTQVDGNNNSPVRGYLSKSGSAVTVLRPPIQLENTAKESQSTLPSARALSRQSKQVGIFNRSAVRPGFGAARIGHQLVDSLINDPQSPKKSITVSNSEKGFGVFGSKSGNQPEMNRYQSQISLANSKTVPTNPATFGIEVKASRVALDSENSGSTSKRIDPKKLPNNQVFTAAIGRDQLKPSMAATDGFRVENTPSSVNFPVMIRNTGAPSIRETQQKRSQVPLKVDLQQSYYASNTEKRGFDIFKSVPNAGLDPSKQFILKSSSSSAARGDSAKPSGVSALKQRELKQRQFQAKHSLNGRLGTASVKKEGSYQISTVGSQTTKKWTEVAPLMVSSSRKDEELRTFMDWHLGQGGGGSPNKAKGSSPKKSPMFSYTNTTGKRRHLDRNIASSVSQINRLMQS